MASSESKPGGFTVTDRRSLKEGGEESAPEPVAAEDDATTRTGDPARAAGDEARPRHDEGLPAVDFHTFVLSLGSSALLHLGELEHPEEGKVEVDLPMAKHTIDILSMLLEKTRGNLTAAEDKLLQGLLFDLRLRYVNAKK